MTFFYLHIDLPERFVVIYHAGLYPRCQEIRIHTHLLLLLVSIWNEIKIRWLQIEILMVVASYLGQV